MIIQKILKATAFIALYHISLHSAAPAVLTKKVAASPFTKIAHEWSDQEAVVEIASSMGQPKIQKIGALHSYNEKTTQEAAVKQSYREHKHPSPEQKCITESPKQPSNIIMLTPSASKIEYLATNLSLCRERDQFAKIIKNVADFRIKIHKHGRDTEKTYSIAKELTDISKFFFNLIFDFDSEITPHEKYRTIQLLFQECAAEWKTAINTLQQAINIFKKEMKNPTSLLMHRCLAVHTIMSAEYNKTMAFAEKKGLIMQEPEFSTDEFENFEIFKMENLLEVFHKELLKIEASVVAQEKKNFLNEALACLFALYSHQEKLESQEKHRVEAQKICFHAHNLILERYPEVAKKMIHNLTSQIGSLIRTLQLNSSMDDINHHMIFLIQDLKDILTLQTNLYQLKNKEEKPHAIPQEFHDAMNLLIKQDNELKLAMQQYTNNCPCQKCEENKELMKEWASFMKASLIVHSHDALGFLPKGNNNNTPNHLTMEPSSEDPIIEIKPAIEIEPA